VNPNDPYYVDQWALRHLGAPDAWSCADPHAPEVIFAVVDTGIAAGHEDLQSCVLACDTVLDILRDDEDHGTLVTGITSAARNNGRGIAGAATVKIVSIKFSSAQYWPHPDRGAEAIVRAADFDSNDARKRVIALPWDVGYDKGNLRRAVEYAGTKDAVVVVAAGNHALDNDKYPNYPANYGYMDHVITVMATALHRNPRWQVSDDRKKHVMTVEERASYSNFGQRSVHVGAPGNAILSTAPYFGGGPSASPIRVGYRYFHGTSASAALVAGLVALVRANNPSWNAARVRAHVLNSARPIPGLEGFCATGGIVDYEKAICPNAAAPVSRRTSQRVSK